MIPAYDAVAGVSHIFRALRHSDLIADRNTQGAHVAQAIAAAPTHFAAAKILKAIADSSYFDGVVCANSPAMAAVVEAVRLLGIPLEPVDALSIGTTDEPFTVRRLTRAGILHWRWKEILDCVPNVQQESSLKLAQFLTRQECIPRVDKTTVPGTYQLDSPKRSVNGRTSVATSP